VIETRNARIKKASLFIEDHGLWTSYLHLEWENSGQGFGGYRLHGEWMYQWVKNVCATVGVSRWEDLEGKHVRIKADYGKVHAIGHIIEDRWLNWSEHAKALQAERKTQDE